MSDALECACGKEIAAVDWVAHLNEPPVNGQRHMLAPESTFKPPEGRPGPRSLKLRTETAARMLTLRGLAPTIGADQMLMVAYRERALRLMLADRLGVTDDELVYYLQLAQTLELEHLVSLNPSSSGSGVPDAVRDLLTRKS